MKVIENIKNAVGSYFLSLEIKYLHRNKTFINMEDAKTIGILFDATDPVDFDLVKKYILYLKDMKKRVKAIGFYNQKQTPPMAYSKLEYDFFTTKDLNWYNFPDNIYVKNFIDEDYDILLDLNIYDSFPLRYISSVSNAKFKVGKSSGKNSATFDMMVAFDPSKGLKYFLRNIDTYLFIINKKHDKQIPDANMLIDTNDANTTNDTN